MIDKVRCNLTIRMKSLGGLLLLSRFVYWSICLEPKAEGGGITHSIEEAQGVTDARWWSVLLVKLTSAPLCILAGFSLGKTGSAV